MKEFLKNLQSEFEIEIGDIDSLFCELTEKYIEKEELQEAINELEKVITKEDFKKAVEESGLSLVLDFTISIHRENSALFYFLDSSGDFAYYSRAYVKSETDLKQVINLLRYNTSGCDSDVQLKQAEDLEQKLEESECSEETEEESSQHEDNISNTFEISGSDYAEYDTESDSSVYTLLSDDKTSDGKGELGVSLNIPYDEKLVPGNAIHKQINRYQNEYREKFYENDQGTPLHQQTKFPEHYKGIKQTILKEQGNYASNKKKRYTFETEEEYLDYKKNSLKKCIGFPYILTVQEECDNQPNRVYPNFSAAKLGYLKKGKNGQDSKLHSKFIIVPRESMKGHSEAQIFEQALSIIKNSEKHKHSDLIVLDINTALSMCSDCHTLVQKFANKVQTEIGREIKVKVRVGYNFPYYKGVIYQGDNDLLFQRQRELPDNFNATSKSFSYNGVVLSSGYRESEKHKKSVECTDGNFLQDEIQRFDTQLGLELTIQNVANDGNCFFHAVVDQLRIVRPDLELSQQDLREEAVNYLRSNENGIGISGFLEGGETTEQYLERMAQDAQWADEIIIRALADALEIDIEITNNNRVGHPTIIGENNTDAQHRIRVGQIGEVHYVSIRNTPESEIDGIATSFEHFGFGTSEEKSTGSKNSNEREEERNAEHVPTPSPSIYSTTFSSSSTNSSSEENEQVDYFVNFIGIETTAWDQS